MAPRPAPSSSTPAHGHDYTPLRVLNRTEEGSGRRTSNGEDDDADDNEGGENKDERRRAGSDGGTTMQRAASEDEEPLLEGQSVNRPTREERAVQRSPWLDAADSTESRSGADTLIMGNMRGYSAWSVQMFALAFMALIWPMVLQRMPWHKLPLFGYHPLAQSLSLILLAQGLLVLQPTTPQTPKRKGQALIWHQLFFLISFLPLVTAGAWIMWHLHSKPRAKHFISWHGTLGAVAVVWAWMQAAVGAASVWFKGRALGGEARAKSMWKWHRLSGYMLLGLFVLIHILAVTETEWVRGSVPLFHRAAAVLAVIGFAAVIATRVQTSKMPQLIRRR